MRQLILICKPCHRIWEHVGNARTPCSSCNSRREIFYTYNGNPYEYQLKIDEALLWRDYGLYFTEMKDNARSI